MLLRFRGAGIVALVTQFALIISTSLQDMVHTLQNSKTSSAATAQPLRTTIASSFAAAYLDCVGIETGYSFFSPGVPGNAKLAVELRYPDGHLEYDVPVVNGDSAGDRVSALLDHLRFIQYVPLREALLRSLVDTIHREHPAVTSIRAVLGTAELPTVTDYRAGKRISYQPLFAYDFRYEQKTKSAARP